MAFVRRRRIALTCALALLGLAGALPAAAQQVVGHVPLLPPDASLNAWDLSRLVADPATADVFVLHARGLTVLDRSATPSLTSLSLGPGSRTAPRDVVFDPLLRRLYASDASTDPSVRGIVVLDARTRATLARIALPFAPGRLGLDPGQALWVAEDQGVHVARVDLGGFAVTVSPDLLGRTPTQIAVDPTSGRAYLVESGYVVVFGPDVTLQRSPFAAASRIVINPASSRLYALSDPNGIENYDLATLTPIGSELWAHGAFAAADPTTGLTYFVEANSLLAYDAMDNVKLVLDLALTPALSPVAAMALDTSRGLLILEDGGSSTAPRVTVVDLSGAAPAVRSTMVLPLRSAYDEMAWSPAAGRAYFLGYNSNILEVDPAASTETAVPIGAYVASAPVGASTGVGFALDLATDRVVAVRVGGTPVLAGTADVAGALNPYDPFAALDEGRNELYLLHEPSLSVLDATTGRLLRTTGLAGFVYGIALDRAAGSPPHTKGYIPHYMGSGAELLRYEPGAVDLLTPIEGCAAPCFEPEAIAVDETAHRAYVTGRGLLRILDTASDSYVADVTLGPGNWTVSSPVLDPATRQIYVGYYDGAAGGVAVVQDGPTPAVSSFPALDEPQALSAAEGSVWFLERGGVIDRVSTASNTVVGTFVTGGTPGAIRAQPGTGLLWVSNEGLDPPAIQVYDAAGLRATLTDVAQVGRELDVFASQPGGRVTFPDNLHGTLAVLDPTAAPVDLQIVAGSLPGGVPGVPYAASLVATGGTGPLRWEVISGHLPAGLALDPDAGDVTGSALAEGTSSFLVRLTDLGRTPPAVDVEPFQIQVLGLLVVTVSLPRAGCAPFAHPLIAAGGNPPYTWSATGLPPGLALDPATGVLAGALAVPISCPAASFEVVVADARGTTARVTLCVDSSSLFPPAVGNELRAVRLRNHVVVSFGAAAIPEGGGANVERTPDAGVTWGHLPIRSAPPSTTTPTFLDFDAVNLVGTAWYRASLVDRCGHEGPR